MRKGVIVWVAMAAILTAAAAWGDSNTLTVSASVTGTCKFVSSSSTLNFGPLDPASAVNVNGSVNPVVQFWCTKGHTGESFDYGNGDHYADSTRNMAGPGGDLIPYTLTFTPSAGPNQGPGTPRMLTIDGSIQGSDYANKSAGSYTDIVTITLNQ